jgi:hypothetical protein
MKIVLVVTVFVLTAASGSRAQEAASADVGTQTLQSDRVVVARIADVVSRFQINQFGDQVIVSTARLDVLETWKGAPQSTVHVVVEGGTVGDLTLRVSDLPLLVTGDRALFFLNHRSDGNERPHDRGRSIMKLSRTNAVEGRENLRLDDLRQAVTTTLRTGAR